MSCVYEQDFSASFRGRPWSVHFMGAFSLKPATNYHTPMMAMHDNSGAKVSRDQGVSTSTCVFNLALVLVEIPQVKDMVRFCNKVHNTEICKWFTN